MSNCRRIFLLLFLFGFGALQAPAQTDVAASVYGAFNSSTSANGTTQSPSNAAGVLLELRHISNPLLGYEFTYSWNGANQNYSSFFPFPPCPIIESPCGPLRAAATVPANAHEFTADWVGSLKFDGFRPFVLAGAGVIVTAPRASSVTTTTTICDPSGSPCSASTTSTATSTHVSGVFVYGAGLDWNLLPHLGLRFQYRGNVYKAPDLARSFFSTGNFLNNSEPVVGAFFQF